VASFLIHIARIRSNPIETFYLPFARCWELFVGTILAYIRINNQDFLCKIRRINGALGRVINSYVSSPDDNTILNFQSFIGLLFILIAVFGLRKDHAFSGWEALLPTIGTVLLISAGPHSWVNNKLLSNRIMVFLGLISYPLYLYHWPLLSYLRIIESGTAATVYRITAILVSIALAWMTYTLIEKPIRYSEGAQMKSVVLVVLMMMVFVVGLITYKNSGFEFRNATSNQKGLRLKVFDPNPLNCGELFGGDIRTFCQETTNKPNVIIVGDSHAGHLYHGFAQSNNPFFNKVKMVGFCGGFAVGPDAPEQCVKHSASVLKYIQDSHTIKIALYQTGQAALI
jgi:hypothetical protein